MAAMDLQDRAQYLSLALFAQGVISALMGYVDENKRAHLKDALEDALSSLLRAKNPSLSPRGRASVFNSYEQLRTLEEVWNADERESAIRMMRAIVRAPSSRNVKPNADKLISLFARLQNQALWNFEQPKPVSPRVLQRLCQLA